MRRRMICSMLVLVALTVNARAQTGDWQAVEHLPRGSRISVKTRFHLLCNFQGATDGTLVCEPVQRDPFFGPHEIIFNRSRIREVRLEHGDDSNTAVGAAVGAGVGAAAGASLGNQSFTRGGSALLFGSIGAIVGGFVGKDFPILHGKVIYKR